MTPKQAGVFDSVVGSPPDPRERDAMLVRVRALKAIVMLSAAAATAALSVTAAHAFKGHDGRKRSHVATAPTQHATTSVNVPGPERVPSIAGSPPQPLTPPAQAPTAAAPAPAPETSGGS